MDDNDREKLLRENIKRAQHKFEHDLLNGNTEEPDNLVILGLSRNDIATLKHVFDDAKLKALFCRDDSAYQQYCNLYAAIFLQVKGEYF